MMKTEKKSKVFYTSMKKKNPDGKISILLKDTLQKKLGKEKKEIQKHFTIMMLQEIVSKQRNIMKEN